MESTRHQASIESWAVTAQEHEYAFHAANEWRRSPRFATDSARLWEHFGFRADQLAGKTVVDVGAGSRLRTRFFTGARIVAIEPLADRFRALDFSDLNTAAACYSTAGEVRLPELVGQADAVVSVNALDHGYDFDTAIENIAAYLKPNASAFLSFDLHEQADEMHPLLLTEASCRQLFANVGLAVVFVRRGVGPFGRNYGHGEAINFWLLKATGSGVRAPGSESRPATGTPSRPTLGDIARRVGDGWKYHDYYDDAEKYIDAQWQGLIWPTIGDADFTHVLDLAAGHGRNSEKLKTVAKHITIVDINQENIDFCQKRFAGDPRFTFVRNDGYSLAAIESNSITLLYSFDAMVHFDSDVVREYVREFARVMRPGAFGFCHHSNYTANPTGDVSQNPGWRNFMSQELFAHYCAKEGLRVVKQQILNWQLPGSDCVTLFQKPGVSGR
jgi:SAM-dependent methyltransferase